MYVLSVVKDTRPRKQRPLISLVCSVFKTSLWLTRNSLKAVCRLVAANAGMGPKLHKIVSSA